MEPNYRPNTVNQTVSFGGRTWRGQPGQGWVDITEESKANDAKRQADAAQQAAQQAYQQQTQQAITGLQTKKTDLAGQYAELLKTVTGQYQPLINQATSVENAFLGSRGLLSDRGLGGNQMSQALQGIYGQQAANAQQIGAGSIADTNTLTQAMAALQAGAAGTYSQLPLQYGELALKQQALPSQIALTQAQATNTLQQYPTTLMGYQLSAAKPFGVGNLVFSPASNTFKTPGAGGGGDNMSVTEAIKLISSMQKNNPSRPSMNGITEFVR